MSEGRQMSEERARQLDLQKKKEALAAVKQKSTSTESKTITDSGKEKRTEFRRGTTGKTKKQARKEASKQKPAPGAGDRKEREKTPMLGETVQILLPKKATEPRSALTKPKILYENIVQGFYDRSGKLPNQSEQIQYLKSQGIEGATKYRAGSVKEALNRAAYVITEIAGGGVREATLGLSGSVGVEKRAGQPLQLIGGILTPSALDYATGAVASKLAKTKTGQKALAQAYHLKLKLINKFDDLGITEGNRALLFRAPDYVEADKFTMDQYRYMNRIIGKISKSEKVPKEIAELASDNVRLFESIAGKGLPTTTERREAARAIRKINDLILDESGLPKKIYGKKINGISIEEISHLPKETLEDLMGDTLKYYRKNPDAPRQYVINETPETDLFRKTIDDLGYFDDAYIDMLKNPKGKIDPNLVASILFYLPPKERKKILEDVADYNLEKPVPGLSESVTPKPDSAIDTSTDQSPTEDEEEDTTPVPAQDEEETTITTQKTVQETATEEEPEPTPEEKPIETPPLRLSPKDREKRREMNLSLYRGKKVLYDVNYSFKGGKTQRVGPLEARSLADALGKAQRRRMSNKTLPRVIVVNMIGERK